MGAGLHRFYATERIIYGRPVREALAEEVERLAKARVLVITNEPVARTEILDQVRQALGDRVAGVFDTVTAHVPREEVLLAARAAEAARADLVVALGGGSVMDAAKLTTLVLHYGITSAVDLYAHAGIDGTDPSLRPGDAAGWLRIVAVPTTLSAAEFTWFGGATDTARGLKDPFGHPYMVPQTVIMDPAATLRTPLPLLFGTGVRAVDHAAERLASLEHQPFCDAVSTEALRRLAAGLRCLRAEPGSLGARLDCQLGAWLSISGGQSGVRVGASHGIGHVLGAHAGVPHGETSCAMLPAVMRWNRPANAERQALVSAAMGRPGEDAGDAIAALVAELGLPGRLREHRLTRDDLPVIAEKAMHDFGTRGNPRPIRRPEDVLEILELAW